MLSAIQSTWRASEASSSHGRWSPIKAGEWGTSLLCHAHMTPLSVRWSCSPNKCPHPALSHRGCRQRVSDNLTGEMRHLHQIINNLTDRWERVHGDFYLSIYLSIHPSIHPSIRPQTLSFAGIHLSIYLSINYKLCVVTEIHSETTSGQQ